MCKQVELRLNVLNIFRIQKKTKTKRYICTKHSYPYKKKKRIRNNLI